MKYFSQQYDFDNEFFQRIRDGEVLIFPTETIYGIGCSALQDKAISHVFAIKGRTPGQAPPVLISNKTQLCTLVTHVSDCAQSLMEQFWPGGLTIILPARDDISSLLCGMSENKSTRTIGIRMTGHPVAKSLCERAAPLVATSANFSGVTGGAAMPRVLSDIPVEFQSLADIVIDGGALQGKASTVVDCTGDTPRVLREGAVDVKF